MLSLVGLVLFFCLYTWCVVVGYNIGHKKIMLLQLLVVSFGFFAQIFWDSFLIHASANVLVPYLVRPIIRPPRPLPVKYFGFHDVIINRFSLQCPEKNLT